MAVADGCLFLEVQVSGGSNLGNQKSGCYRVVAVVEGWLFLVVQMSGGSALENQKSGCDREQAVVERCLYFTVPNDSVSRQSDQAFTAPIFLEDPFPHGMAQMYFMIFLTLVLLNKLRCHAHF